MIVKSINKRQTWRRKRAASQRALAVDREEELHCALRLRWKPLGRVSLDAKAGYDFRH